MGEAESVFLYRRTSLSNMNPATGGTAERDRSGRSTGCAHRATGAIRTLTAKTGRILP